jgi:hypothetical protein
MDSHEGRKVVNYTPEAITKLRERRPRTRQASAIQDFDWLARNAVKDQSAQATVASISLRVRPKTKT